MFFVRTILHPTDFSECSTPAFHVACAMARTYDARLVVVHVATPSAEPLYTELPPLPFADRTPELHERLKQVMPRDPKVRTEHLLVEGDPVAEILRLARETPFDLIVMGTHGRTGFGRLFIGSVAEQVLRKASCPVLTVKLPMPEPSAPAPAKRKPGKRMVKTEKIR